MKLSSLAATVTIAFILGLSPMAWGQPAEKETGKNDDRPELRKALHDAESPGS
jgi:hypothetical protein